MEETRQRPVRANRGEKLKRYLEEEELISSFKRKKLKTQEGSDSNGDIGDDKHNENELEENTTIRSVEGKKEQEQEQQEEEGEAEDETYQDNDDVKSNNKDDDDEEDEEVRCLPCGATTENYEESEDTLGDMVQCDNCKTWQHAKCMGYKTKKSIPEVHKCDVCTGKPVTPIRQKGKPKKKEEPIEDTGIAGLKDKIRISTAKAFYNYFKKRFTNRAEGELKALDSLSDEQRDEKANAFAIEIEKLIFEEFKGPAYTTEGRRILFVLKKHFMNEIVEGTVSFKDVLHKTPQEINEDIAKVEQQNRENIKNIILTENDTSQIIRRTHKGDVIKENEFVQSSFIDESIAARKVDHRKFSDDVLYPGRIISHTANESNSYQNLNPRIVDDDSDSDHDGDGDGENKASASENVPDREKSKSTESLSDIETAKQNGGNANEDDDEDDILPFLSGGEDSFDNTVVEKQHVWSGRITFPDFATFNALGDFYSCTDEPLKEKDMITNVSKELLNLPEYIVHGKLDRTVADDYLTKVVNSRDLYIIEISNDDKIGDKQYLKLYEYLLHKNKVGVLRIKLKFVKDSYLMPIDFRDEKLPSYLKAYKKDLRIGLYAVFVVQRNYIPHGSVKDTEYKPIEHIPIVPKYPSIEKPHPKTQLQHQPPYQYPQENQANRSGDQPVNTNLADILKLLN